MEIEEEELIDLSQIQNSTNNSTPKINRIAFERKIIENSTCDLTVCYVKENLEKLAMIEYPGIVKNPTKALRTLGGIYKISEVMETPKKKLELRFRPGDPYSRPAYGESMIGCGLLIRLRRRRCKVPSPQRTDTQCDAELIDLINIEDPPNSPPPTFHQSIETIPSTTDFNVIRRENENQEYVVFNGPLPDELRSTLQIPSSKSLDTKKIEASSKNESVIEETHHLREKRKKILEEEQEYLEKLTTIKRIEKLCDGITIQDFSTGFLPGGGNTPSISSTSRNRLFIQVPQQLQDIRAPRSNYQITVLGAIDKIFKFTGMCDFQYLPMKKSKNGGNKIILDQILPVFPDPDDPAIAFRDLIVCDLGRQGHDSHIPPFIVPSVMSRVDKPIEDFNGFVEGNKDKELSGLTGGSAGTGPMTIGSNRIKRVIYSHLINFRAGKGNVDETAIPVCALPEAIEDADKRGLSSTLREMLSERFQIRPIWTRLQLEHEMNLSHFALRYLLPCIAYFAINGPWRSCWIRIGFDPRKNPFTYKFQLLDYRVPNSFRFAMERCEGTTKEVDPVTLFRIREDEIPPKAQMIYQLCEVKLNSVQKLQDMLENRCSEGLLQYDIRFGFLDEDVIEYCRYSITRQIENFLYTQGKLNVLTLIDIPFPNDGKCIPKETLAKKVAEAAALNRSSSQARAVVLRKLRTTTGTLSAPVVPQGFYEGLDDDRESTASSNIEDLTLRDDQFSDDEEDEEIEDAILNEAIEATSAPQQEFDDNPLADVILGP